MARQKVYLFGTCLIDVFYPNAGLDAISLLELCGYDVIFPQAQTCCGQPPYNSGYSEPTKVVAIQTISTFSDHAIPVIVPSASCAGMIKHHYPDLFSEQDSIKQLAINLSKRTFELIDFIQDKLPYEQQVNSSPRRVTLHESCSAQREMKVANAWSTVLSKLHGVTTVKPAYAEECCGFGGTFSVKSPAVSAAMTEDKCKHLLASDPEVITSGDSGCLMNIGEHLKFEGNSDDCVHLASFIAQRFGVAHEQI